MTLQPPLPPEQRRARLSQELRLLAGEREASFDAIARLVALQTGCPEGRLMLADATTVWCLASNTSIDAAQPLGDSLHDLMLRSNDQMLLATDTLADSRTARMPEVNRHRPVRCYLAAAVTVDGMRLGVVCAFDTEPHRPSPTALASLRDLATLAGEMLTARLRERRARLLAARVRTASGAASDWLWETDADGIVTWLTADLPARGLEDFGHALGDRWLRPYEALAALRPEQWARCMSAFRDHSAFDEVLTDAASAEGRVTVSSSGRPVFDSSGRFMGFRGASRDVTIERRQREASERALTDSQARLSTILGAIPDSWFVLDEKGTYLETNNPSRDAVTGSTLDAVMPASVARELHAAIARALADGETQRVDYTLDGPADTRLYAASISPMADRRVLWLARDVTSLRTLQRDREVLQRALEADAAMPIAVLEAPGGCAKVVLVNKAFERLSGYERSELLGNDLWVLQRDLQAQPGCDELEAAIRQGVACTVQVTSRRKDGSRFSNEIHLAPVRSDDDTVVQFVCVLNDVTERTTAAEQLRMSEELYRAVATTMSDGMFIVMSDGAIAAVNPAACAILGVDAASLLDRRMPWPFEFELAAAGAGVDAMPIISRALNEGTSVTGQAVLMHRPDGSTRWLELNCHPLHMPAGDGALPLLATFRDITAQRRAEQSLAMSEERWKFALEGSGQGVWDWNPRGEGMFYSEGWKAILGYAPHEMESTYDDWEQRVHPDDLPATLELLASFLKGDMPVLSHEYRIRHRDGRYLWTHSRARVVRREDSGRALRVVGTLVDITARHNAEVALREKHAAELASRAKSEFLSRMSHEMRTPLNAVIGFSQLLLNRSGETDTGQAREYAEHVLRAGEHLLDLINDVLDLQRVEEGRIVPDWSDVRVLTMATRVTELLAAAAGQRRVTVEMRIDPEIAVRADERLFRQVLLNVASNAIKYNREQGVVRWSMSITTHGRVQIHVDDSGLGLSPEQLARLFEPFDRLGQETSPIQGSGLGLIIARRLCLAMGGLIDVSSRVGRGTRVTVTLPLSRTMTEAAPTSPAPLGSGVRSQRPSDAPPLRVLYVEDNRINAILFEAALGKRPEIELRCVEDGEAALQLVADWTPDVLVLDAHLPGMDGFALFEALRGLPGLEMTPAFMCSADAMPEDIHRAKVAGFAGYWTKPIDMERIVADLEDVGFALARRAETRRPQIA